MFKLFVETWAMGSVCFFNVIMCRLGNSAAGAHMRSVRAFVIKTHFSISWFVLETAPKQVTSGLHYDYRVRSPNLYEKRGA